MKLVTKCAIAGNISTTGWTTIFCTNPTTCTSPETAVTLTATGGKLRMQTNKRYGQAYYLFTTVPGRVYRVKYKLSGVTFGLTSPLRCRANPFAWYRKLITKAVLTFCLCKFSA